jgi:hypothetical protein
MSTLVASRLPKPESWIEFEKQVCAMAKIRWNSADFARHGRTGEKQYGVDVFGSAKDGAWLGLQCKLTFKSITKSIILKEVKEAEGFSPALSTLYIATTADKSVKIQAFARELSDSRRAEGKFLVWILFWEDVCDDLSRDESILFQFFPYLRPTPVASGKPTHDQLLFKRFQKDLAFSPVIQLLRDHDFRMGFKEARIAPLGLFVQLWNDVEHEFVDPSLQEALQFFYSEAAKMSSCIAERTTYVHSSDTLSVDPYPKNFPDGRTKDQIREARKMNEAAQRFVPLYENFLRLCKSKLST